MENKMLCMIIVIIVVSWLDDGYVQLHYGLHTIELERIVDTYDTLAP